MNNLNNDIYRYYLDNWSSLPFDKQMHFASRLHLWSQDPGLSAKLAELRPTFTADDTPRQALEAIVELAKASPVHGSKNAAELRRPYFERYPDLKLCVSLLFRVHFMRIIYGVDARDMLHELVPAATWEKLHADLLQDDGALAILSTHAINFLYLYDRSVKGDDTALPLERFLEVGRRAYDLDDRLHLQLFIYLYTHCIIGESLFYFRKIPAQLLATYQTMMQELETVISQRYDDINMDNKFEFLVCARITGHASALDDRIFDEAARSVSEDGTFIIDRHNKNPQTDNNTLDKSEHRNVLFLMSNRTFSPLG